MNQNELFHVGVVVPEIMAARARFAELLGTVWGPVTEFDSELRDAAGDDFRLVVKACFSTVAPYLELIEAIPGSYLECNEGSNIHHIGFWSTALAEESARLTAARCPLLVCGRQDDQAPALVAFHRDFGVRFELCDIAQQPFMEQNLCVATG